MIVYLNWLVIPCSDVLSAPKYIYTEHEQHNKKIYPYEIIM